MNLKQGALLKNGEYRIEMMLGQGGFGITYLGVQTSLGRKVAIKEFFMKGVCERDADTSQVSVSNADNKELVSRFREKFLKEARSIASLEHPHIVPIIDVFECNGTAYYVMKHFSGASLADKVRGGALPESDAVRYIRQVAEALDFVHSKRMMHLDVKPANILLSDDDKAVLIDFGLAKQYDTEGQQTSSTPVGISHGYAPLEQYRRGGVSQFSPATDIYSLGATLFKLVTGVTPPEASDVNDEGLPALPSEISPAVRDAIEAAMEPRRRDRPQSIAEFLAMLTENCGERVGESLLAHKASVSSLGEAKTETNERVGESLLAHKTSVSSLGEAKTENSEAISDSKDPGTLTDDLISPDEVEITAVPNGYVNEETRVVTKDPKDSKDPKETNTPKAPESINETIIGGFLAVVAVAVAVLLCVGIWRCVNDNSDGGYDSYSASSSSYTSYDDSNSDSNADAQRQREEEERIAREAEAQRLADEQRAREEQQGISTQKKVDLGLSVCWAGWNVGASSPEGYGNYYAWGETTTKSNYTEGSYQYHNGSSYINIGSNISGTQYDVARSQWGGSWRLPTKAECQELVDRCTWSWTTYKGVPGYKVTGPNGNSIFLPAAGCCYGTEIYGRGSSGSCWSGTLLESYSSYSAFAYYLSFNSSGHDVSNCYRENGRTVRPVSE